MRICILNEFFYPDLAGGTGMVLSELARQLHDDHGVEVDVLTSRATYRGEQMDLLANESWDGIRITRLPSPSVPRQRTLVRLAANFWFTFLVLIRLLARPRYDAVLVSSAPPVLPMAAALYRMLRGVPYSYIIYDLEPDRAVAMQVAKERGLASRILRRFQRGWLHSAAQVVAIGRCMQDYLRDHYDISSNHSTVIEIGVDADRIRPLDRNNAMRERLGWGDDFVALYSGNFGRYHDFSTLLDGAERLRDSAPGFRLVLCGNGVKEEWIREEIATRRLTNVDVIPFVTDEEYPLTLSAADVSLITLEPGMEGLCVPSKFYTILASGRPSIAVMEPHVEVARTIDETGCGVVVHAHDVDAFVAAVHQVWERPERAARMGQIARSLAEERYGNRMIARKYLSTIQAGARPLLKVRSRMLIDAPTHATRRARKEERSA